MSYERWIEILLVMIALLAVYGYVQNRKALDRLEELRQARAADINRTAFEGCIRDNFQDVRNRAQDELLLALIVSVLDPSGDPAAQRRVFIDARDELKARVEHPPQLTLSDQTKDGKGIDEMPRNCYELPTAKIPQ